MYRMTAWQRPERTETGSCQCSGARAGEELAAVHVPLSYSRKINARNVMIIH